MVHLMRANKVTEMEKVWSQPGFLDKYVIPLLDYCDMYLVTTVTAKFYRTYPYCRSDELILQACRMGHFRLVLGILRRDMDRPKRYGFEAKVRSEHLLREALEIVKQVDAHIYPDEDLLMISRIKPQLIQTLEEKILEQQTTSEA